MCEYCEETKLISEDTDGYESKLLIYNGMLDFRCDSGIYDFTVYIKYCPMCGKKL